MKLIFYSEPHPIFVIFLTGPNQEPFGVQRDLICAHSSYFRTHFDKLKEEEKGEEKQIEHVVKLLDVMPGVFGLIQNFLYTGHILSDTDELPGYDILIATWKAANKFGILPLCEEVLTAMIECRKITRSIPATPLLVQAWKDTPEGSKIRQLLLSWAAEYIRSSESRAEFSKSLPQEVLSELVVEMSQLNSAPAIQSDPDLPPPRRQTKQKNAHHMEDEDSDTEISSKASKKHHSDAPTKRHSLGDLRNGTQSPFAKPSRGVLKTAKAKRASANLPSDQEFSPRQKMQFCADLLNRMLSGPGTYLSPS